MARRVGTAPLLAVVAVTLGLPMIAAAPAGADVPPPVGLTHDWRAHAERTNALFADFVVNTHGASAVRSEGVGWLGAGIDELRADTATGPHEPVVLYDHLGRLEVDATAQVAATTPVNDVDQLALDDLGILYLVDDEPGSPAIAAHAPDGTLLWSAPATGDLGIVDVAARPLGGLVLLGRDDHDPRSISGEAIPAEASYVIALNAVGTVDWVQGFPGSAGPASLAVGATGDVTFTGTSPSTFDLPDGTTVDGGTYVVRLSALGAVTWVTRVTGEVLAGDVAVGADGGAWFTGHFSEYSDVPRQLQVEPPIGTVGQPSPPLVTPYTLDGFLVALGPDGTHRWTRPAERVAHLALDAGPLGSVITVSRARGLDVPMRLDDTHGSLAPIPGFTTRYAADGTLLSLDPLDGAPDAGAYAAGDGSVITLTRLPPLMGFNGAWIDRYLPTVTAGAPPGPPLDLVATPGDGEVTLAWAPPAVDGGAPVTRYRVLRDGEVITEVDPTVLSVTDGPIANGVDHRYRVVTVNGRGQGATDPVTAGGVGPTDGAPQVRWARYLNRGTNRSVVATADGGAFVAGAFDNPIGSGYQLGPDGDDTIDLGPGNPAFVARTNHRGRFAWAATLDGVGVESVTGLDLAPDGGVYAAGYFRAAAVIRDTTGTETELPDPGTFVARFSADGVLRWVHTIHGENRGIDLAADDAGNVTVTGILPSDVVARSYDANGVTRWTLEGDLGEQHVAVSPGGRVYIGGSVVIGVNDDIGGTIGSGPGAIPVGRPDNSDGHRAFIAEIGPTGQPLHVVDTDGSSDLVDLAVTTGGDVVAIGDHGSEMTWGDGPDALELPGPERAYVLWFDADLVPEHGQTMSTGPLTVAPGPDGEVLVGGRLDGDGVLHGADRSVDLDPISHPDGFLARFDADGSVPWATQIGGAGDEPVMDVSVAPDGSSRAVGQCSDGEWVRLGQPGHVIDVGRPPLDGATRSVCDTFIRDSGWVAGFGPSGGQLAVPTVPGPVRDLTATPRIGGVRLRWRVPLDDGGAARTGWQVLRDGQPVDDLAASDRTAVVPEATPGEGHGYQVVAVNDVGPGDPGPAVDAASLAPPGPHGFTDVRAGSWIDDALDWLADEGIVSGFADGTFRPRGHTTRGQMAQWLWTFMDRPEDGCADRPSDVPASAWNATAVCWLVDSGVAGGYRDGTFRPNLPVSRGQMATWLWRLAGGQEVTEPHPFTDVDPSAAVSRALDWLAAHHLADGFVDGTFRPARSITRGELANMLHRLASTEVAWTTTPPSTVIF